MQLWQDGLVAMLAAVGLASLMWAAVKVVLYAGPEKRQGVVAVIPAQGDGESLEEQVHVLERLRQEQGVIGMILLVDCGLSEEGEKLSRMLERKDRCAAVTDEQFPGGERAWDLPRSNDRGLYSFSF